MAEYIIPECGDCLHASLCEMLPLSGINSENPAYCKAFKSAANMVEVVRCKDCKYYKRNGSSYGECPFFDEVKDDEYCSSGEAKMDGKGEG